MRELREAFRRNNILLNSPSFDKMDRVIQEGVSLVDLEHYKSARDRAERNLQLISKQEHQYNVFDPKNDADQQVGTNVHNRISSTDTITLNRNLPRNSDGSVTLTAYDTELRIERPLYTQAGISFIGARQASTEVLDSSSGDITTDGVAVAVDGSMNAVAGSVEARNSGSFIATGDITAASVKGLNGGQVVAHGKIEAKTVSGHVHAGTGINGGDASLPKLTTGMAAIELEGVHSAKVEGESHIVVTRATAETHNVSGVGESGNLAEHYEVNNTGEDAIDHQNVYAKTVLLKGNNKVGTLEGDEATFSKKDGISYPDATAHVETLKVKDTKVESGTTLNIGAVEERVSGTKNLLHGGGTAKLKTLDSVQLGATDTALGKAILGEGQDSLSLSGEHYVGGVELAASTSRISDDKSFENDGDVTNKGHLIVEGEFSAERLDGDSSTSAVTYQSKDGATIDYDIAGHKKVTFAGGAAGAEEPTTFTVTSGTIGADVVAVEQDAKTVFDSDINVWGKVDNAGVVDVKSISLWVRDGFINKAGGVTNLHGSVVLDLSSQPQDSIVFDNQAGARLNVYDGGKINYRSAGHASDGAGLKNAGDIDLTNGAPLVVEKAFTIVGTEGRVLLGKIDSYDENGLIMKVGSFKTEDVDGKKALQTLVFKASDTDGSARITLGEAITVEEAQDLIDNHLRGTGNKLLAYSASFDTTAEKIKEIVVAPERDDAAIAAFDLNPDAADGLLALTKVNLSQPHLDDLNMLLSSGSRDDIRTASEQSTSTAVTASTQAGIAAGRASNGAVSTRLASLRTGGVQLANLEGNSGVSSGDEIRRNGMWLKGSGSLAEQGRRSGLAGYSSHTRGMTLGMDSLAADNLRVGFALSTAQSKVKSKGADDTRTDVMSYQFATYGSYEPGPYFVEGQVAYALNNTDTKRTVIGGDTATGDFKAHQYTASLGAGVPFGFADGITLTPKAGLFYSRTQSNEYTETGAGPQNLTVKPEATQLLEANLGATLAYEHVNLDGSMFCPELRAAALYEFFGEKATATSKYSGAGATVTPGVEPAQFGGTAGLGIAYTTADGQWEVRADYDAEIRQDYISHNGMLTGRLNF